MEKTTTKSNAGTWVLVFAVLGGLAFVAIFVIGILAAIAIPSFMKYVSKSKAIEGEMQVRTMQSGIADAYAADCKLPSILPATGDIPTGGEKAFNDASAPFWDEIGMAPDPVPNPGYFRYRTQPTATGLKVIAESDFMLGGPVHTVEGELIKMGDCGLDIVPVFVSNELQ